MAAVADFNSGNMLLTPELSIFTAGMTLSLHHLKHPVKPTACEKRRLIYRWRLQLLLCLPLARRNISLLLYGVHKRDIKLLPPCFGINNETGCGDNKKLNENEVEGGWGEERMRQRAVIIDGGQGAMAEMRSFVSGKGRERKRRCTDRAVCGRSWQPARLCMRASEQQQNLSQWLPALLLMKTWIWTRSENQAGE